MNTKLSRLETVVLAICLVIAVGFTVYIATAPKMGERFTEFYILGPGRTASEYPTNLTLGETGRVVLGVVNHEFENVSYRIIIQLEDKTIGEINRIDLTHDEVWEADYDFIPDTVGNNLKLVFLLQRNDMNVAYRQLHLWLTVHPNQ